VDDEFYEKGGAELKRACMAVKGCGIGKAVATIGGALPAKYVIHTACPRFSGDGSDKKYLEKCYIAVMDLAMANGYHDVALAPIGSGYFSYPLRECAIVASQTVDRWMLKHADYPLKLTFVCPDQRTEAMFLSMRK
jgi:O-acetyl-ADP-ribose deacetylase (regulator of RNase III)